MSIAAPGAFRAELIVESYLSGVRIDSFLIRHFRNYTSFRMQRMIRAGHAAIDGVRVGLASRVFRGQRVTMCLTEPPDKLLESQPLPLDILYEDPWLIVINKRAGMASHPVGDYQSDTLSNALQHHFDRQTALPGLLRAGIVHRLDRLTSGVIVVAKEHLAHRRLSIGFQRGRVAKRYVAVVDGLLSPAKGVIDRPIGAAPGSVLMSAEPTARDAKPAITRYEVLRRFDSHSLVRATPLTGRNHQIRVHLASIGHPVVGDVFYGPFGRFRRLPRAARENVEMALDEICAPDTTSTPLIARHALHAERIALEHPITREPLDFRAPLPPDMVQLLRQLSHPAVSDFHVVASCVGAGEKGV